MLFHQPFHPPTHIMYSTVYNQLFAAISVVSFPKLITFTTHIVLKPESLLFPVPIIAIQCFSRWNGRNPSCLSNLLQELLSEYRSHHRALACQYQRLNFEMQTLLDSGQFQDVDVHCTRRTDSVS